MEWLAQITIHIFLKVKNLIFKNPKNSYSLKKTIGRKIWAYDGCKLLDGFPKTSLDPNYLFNPKTAFIKDGFIYLTKVTFEILFLYVFKRYFKK